MDRTIYIHYGHKKFVSEQFNNPKNYIPFTKPSGGLWASPINTSFGWKEYLKRSLDIELDLEDSFKFILADEANVVHIYSIDDLKRLPLLDYNSITTNIFFIDFEQLLSDGIDAIELHLTEEKILENAKENFFSGLYFALDAWNCDSILILNKDVIVPI